MVPCNGPIAEPTVQQEDSGIRLASLDPAQRPVSTINIVAPTPMMPPGYNPVVTADAVVPFAKTPALIVATRGVLSTDGQTALGAITGMEAPQPAPGLLAEEQVLTAYAPESVPDPGAERALQMIISREATASTQPPAKVANIDTSELRTASLGTNGIDTMKNIFDMTWQAVTNANGASAIASTLTNATIDRRPLMGLKAHDVELVPPEIDHVNETLTTPVAMTDLHYAELYEPEGYLDNSAELGPLANRIALESDLVAPPRYDVFVVRSPMLVVAR